MVTKKTDQEEKEAEDNQNKAGKAAEDDKGTGNMIKTVTRMSVKFGAQR